MIYYRECKDMTVLFSRNKHWSGVLLLFDNNVENISTALHIGDLGREQIKINGWNATGAKESVYGLQAC